jgi:hypothetical protein
MAENEMPRALAGIAVTCLTVSVPILGNASRDAAKLCADAAVRAASQTGVPYDVLLAVSVVETGLDGRPWPWTVNLGGEGHWLETAEDAETLVYEALAQGRTNIDIGCFQLNHRWHGHAFASVADMLSPEANALYAAEYLSEHHGQTGDWAAAAAAYHSSTPEHAERYQARFESAWANLAGQGPESATLNVPPDRLNLFPLLAAGQSGSPGSLVPDTAVGRRLIGGP